MIALIFYCAFVPPCPKCSGMGVLHFTVIHKDMIQKQICLLYFSLINIKVLTIRTQCSIIEYEKGEISMRIKDIRKGNMTITSPGGNASKGAIGFRVTIPTSWGKDMGITPGDRTIMLSYTDDKKIIIEKLPED